MQSVSHTFCFLSEAVNLSYIKMLKLVYTTQSRPCALCSAPTTHPLLILKHLQVGVSMSATLEAPKAAQIAETNVTTEVAETIKSEVDPLQEEVSTSL